MAPSPHATDKSKRSRDKSQNNDNATESTSLLQPSGSASTTTAAVSRRPSRMIPYHTDDYTPHATFSHDSDARDHEQWLERLGASRSSSGTSTPKHSKSTGIKKQSSRGSKANSLPEPGVLIPVQAIHGESTTRTLAIHHGVDHSWWG
ncbi:hypothetical protein KEM54_003450 [Ascosphaera aggregata]|nr:hypothetical protein KEM54_003450 [Ascosphaera aggregata]